MGETYTYATYGLRVESALRLPELERSRGRGDVLIRRETLGTPPLHCLRDRAYHGRTPDETMLVWGDLVTVSARGGREIGFDVSPEADEYWLRQCLLGPAFGVMLHQRGHLVLHASAVEMDGEAVVIMGEKGMGKSTTAAALSQRGHPLLADDIVAIDLDEGDGCPRVRPGFRHVKLREDAADAVQLRNSIPLEPELDLPKYSWPVSAANAERAPVRIRHVYILQAGDVTECAPLSSAETFAELVTHSYALRFIGRTGYTPPYLAALGCLVPHVRAARLTRRASLDHLSELIDVIEHRREGALR